MKIALTAKKRKETPTLKCSLLSRKETESAF